MGSSRVARARVRRQQAVLDSRAVCCTAMARLACTTDALDRV